MLNDTVLVTLPCNIVEQLLSYRQDDEDGVASVIERLASHHLSQNSANGENADPPDLNKVKKQPRGIYQYSLLGEKGAADTLGKLLVSILRCFAELDENFLGQYCELRGRTRRFVARHPAAIYPGRGDLSKLTAEVRPGWYVGTNYSKIDIRRLLRGACQVAGIKWRDDLIVNI